MKAGKFPPFHGTMKEKVHHLVARQRPPARDLSLWLTRSKRLQRLAFLPYDSEEGGP
jgi:hypothetical protein